MDDAAKAVALLIEKGLHVAAAESCTGGLVSAAIVSVPDASKVLNASFVTYANEAKEKFVGVSAATIARFDVVSEQVAAEMASGAAAAAGAQVGLSTTGYAGPGGGVPGIPVGTVCFGVYVEGKGTFTFSRFFAGMGRNEIREASASFVIGELIKILTDS